MTTAAGDSQGSEIAPSFTFSIPRTHTSKIQIQMRMFRYILVSWFNKWGIKINESKPLHITFSLRPQDKRFHGKLLLNSNHLISQITSKTLNNNPKRSLKYNLCRDLLSFNRHAYTVYYSLNLL